MSGVSMRIGGLAWFLVGVLVGVAVRFDWLTTGFGVVTGVLSGVATFLSHLGSLGAAGILGLVLIVAVAFARLGTTWAENARARTDMDRTWRQRRNYRLPADRRAK